MDPVMDIALFILRIVVGLLFAAHGAQKLFGWFGGYGLKGTSGWIASLGLKPAGLWTLAAALGEFAGGLLLAFGLFTPFAAIAVAATMLMAIVLAHWPKVFASDNGLELPLVLLAAVVAVALTGPGTYSLDAVLSLAIPTVYSLAFAVIAGLGILLALGSRTVPAPAATQATD